MRKILISINKDNFNEVLKVSIKDNDRFLFSKKYILNQDYNLMVKDIKINLGRLLQTLIRFYDIERLETYEGKDYFTRSVIGRNEIRCILLEMLLKA